MIHRLYAIVILSHLLCGALQAQGTRGFENGVKAQSTIEEIVRQPDLWMMEVQFKQMRMVYVPVVDPQTGKATEEHVWYLAYRFINRPVASRPNEDSEPINQLDPLPGPRMFQPKFTLITYDNPETEIPIEILQDDQDDIVPDALPRIREIERVAVENSVGLYRELPETVAEDAEEQPWVYGVATWRNVDPHTDFFKVIMTGFSNGYELRPGDDQATTWRRAIVQKFRRPGDEFDPNRKEFSFDGTASWIFVPDGK